MFSIKPNKIKLQLSPCMPLRHTGERGKTPLIANLSTRWMLIGQLYYPVTSPPKE